MGDLYESDILEWSEHQAALLRRAAAGERVNDLVDWPNIVEEIEFVGNYQLHAAESLLTQAMLHMLEIRAWPDARDVALWEHEAALFRKQARRRYTRTMGKRIDLADLYDDALLGLRSVAARPDARASLPVPSECPFTLDELLGKP